MKFGLKRLDPEIGYTIADINRIRLQDKAYLLRIVFHYVENGQELFAIRYANIQFGRQLRIGAKFVGDKVKLGDKTVVVDLPQWLCRSKSEILLSTECMDDESHYQGKFDYKEYGKYQPLEHKVVRLTPLGRFPVMDKSVHFVIVPSYEFYRFFVFGHNKYNELLMLGTSFENKKSNKIYNPAKTGIVIDGDGKKHCYIHLRRKITDESASIAGDLAFNPEINGLAKSMVNSMAFEENKRSNFDRGKFPINQVTMIRAYGRFVKNNEGKDGFYIESFAKIEYGEPIYFGRDNDGRTTSSRKEDMPEIYGGKGKQKTKRKAKSPIDHDQTGDRDIEPESLNESFESFDFEDRSFEANRVGKETQENIAGKKSPGGEVEPKGKASMSDIGPGHTGFTPIDNTIPLGPNDITEKKYWEGFASIIEYMSPILAKDVKHSISYLGKDLKFTNDATKSNFMNVLELQNKSEFYLVRIRTVIRTFYIIEINPEEYDVPTMVLWNKDNNGVILDKDLEIFLEKYFNCKGIPKKAAGLMDNITLRYGTVKHQYQDTKKRYEKDEALKHQGLKLANLIVASMGSESHQGN